MTQMWTKLGHELEKLFWLERVMSKTFENKVKNGFLDFRTNLRQQKGKERLQRTRGHKALSNSEKLKVYSSLGCTEVCFPAKVPSQHAEIPNSQTSRQEQRKVICVPSAGAVSNFVGYLEMRQEWERQKIGTAQKQLDNVAQMSEEKALVRYRVAHQAIPAYFEKSTRSSLSIIDEKMRCINSGGRHTVMLLRRDDRDKCEKHGARLEDRILSNVTLVCPGNQGAPSSEAKDGGLKWSIKSNTVPSPRAHAFNP
ncbi:hypothetical protein BT69DRAFT_1325796 [Atractiella rhizophila]|nr:hypothetical protein BT69DRAFT_1325796 [Atractiella rhizophila]